MSKVQAQTKSVRELLSNVEYSIDYYQREYAWRYQDIEDLIFDLTSSFRAQYSPEHSRAQVKAYSHYFLGTIITVEDGLQKYIVDGQQRLTTITLLLICVNHLRDGGNTEVSDVTPMIYSEKYDSSKSLNLAVPDRNDCMQALFETGKYDIADLDRQSVRNLIERYEDISTLFLNSLGKEEIPYFVNWLIDNVDFVEIEASTTDVAFTVFETMNDRGLRLTNMEKLKGYLLSNIKNEDTNWVHENKSKAEENWKQRVFELVGFGKDVDHEFVKAWLRAKYAVSGNDFDYIDKFYRWVRDNSERLELNGSQDYYEFITRRFDRFAALYVKMQEASQTLTLGKEEIYYNNSNGFTLQYLLLLSPISLEDDDVVTWEKIRLASIFIDIFLARRMVNSLASTYDNLRTQIFNLAKEIRGMEISGMRTFFFEYLEKMTYKFDAIFNNRHYSWFYYLKTSATHRKNLYYLLQRMTTWIDQECQNDVHFTQFAGGRLGSHQVEHLMSSTYSSYKYGWIEDEDEYKLRRNLFGALVLLPRGTNQSLGGSHYEDKIMHYVKENLLAASLHPKTYENNPNFTNFINRSGLPFKSHSQFKLADLLERQELYRQICEQIWNPDRLLAND